MLGPGLKSIIPRVSRKFALPEPDPTRKHLFVLNHNAQTVTCIDTSNDTVDSTITLPSGSYACMHYRLIDDSIYLWGTNSVCKINANPADANFKQVTNLAGTANASSSVSYSGLGSYTFIDCAYDPVHDIVFFTNGSVTTLYYWDFKSLNGSTVNGFVGPSEAAPASRTVYYVGNGRMAFGNQGGTTYYDSRTRKKLGFHNTIFNISLSQSLCWVKKHNYVYRGYGSVSYYNSDYDLAGTMTIGAGQSGYTQLISCLTYCPDYDLMFGTIKQTNTDTYIFDISNNSYVGTFNRTNLDTNETFSVGAAYSMYSKKIYLRGGGTTGTAGRVHVFNPQLWVNNGKTTLTDMIDGYITVGNLTNANTNFSITEHKICMNHLVPY